MASTKSTISAAVPSATPTQSSTSSKDAVLYADVTAIANSNVTRTIVGPFDVKSPPIKKHMVAGHLVPTFRTATRFLMVQRRRITVEIQSPTTLATAQAAPLSDKETATTRPWDPEKEILNDNDIIVLRIFRLARKTKHGDMILARSGEDDGTLAGLDTLTFRSFGRRYQPKAPFLSSIVCPTVERRGHIGFNVGPGPRQ